MTLSDMLSFSILNLRRRGSRTILTVLGIVLGAALIILMISLGLGSNAATDELISNWGDLTTIEVYGNQTNQIALNDVLLDEFRRDNDIDAATPMLRFMETNGEILTERNNTYACGIWNITGIEGSSMQAMGYELLAGSYLSEMYLGKDTIPIVVSQYFAFDFHDTTKPLEHPDYMRNLRDEMGNLLPNNAFFDNDTEKLILRVYHSQNENGDYEHKDYKLVVVGTLLSENEDGQNANGIYMNVSDMHRIENDFMRLDNMPATPSRAAYYDTVYIKVNNIDNVDKVENALQELGFDTYSMNKVRNDMRAQVAQGQMMLAGIAAVSLLVAAMNIANTMNTAILERTKEIGIMKVIGCNPQIIRFLFLIEAALIGLLGGVAGGVCGFILSKIINKVPEWTAESATASEGVFSFLAYSTQGAFSSTPLSIVPAWLFIAAIAFTTMIGILSGLSPSNRAVKVSSLEAIRRE